MVFYLLALGLTFSFPLFYEQFSVCLSFVYLETMFGSRRPWLARYIGPLLVFLSEMGSCLSWSISLFFPKQLHAALILAHISYLVVSLRCVICPRYLHSVTFSIFCWSISMTSLSAWFVMYFVFPLRIVKPTFRLSEFKLFRCFYIFVVVVLLKRATSSANLKLVRFSPSTLTPSEMPAFLNTSSMTAVNNLGESGSPCLTPLCIGNSVDTSLSRWTLAVTWLYMFCRMFMYV